jgi:NADH:ubiquinone oxidoreductase subunit F (NADH-binding)
LPRIQRRDQRLLAEFAASGITGRGGAWFPTATKLAAVADKRRTGVVANGTEGEPASRKDVVLLAHNPHLVLDGLTIAAGLVGAREATIAVTEGRVVRALEGAIAERPRQEQPRLVVVPGRFIAGEETALLSAASGGAGLPTGRRPFADGVLVQNVETLAHLALVARYGADWFRSAGTDAEPGTALATVAGVVASPGVVEFELGSTLGGLFERCGGLLEPVDAVLIGGYFGCWLRAEPELELTNEALRARGASLGARVIVAFPRSACGLAEVARVVQYLANESAGQCGPCVFGLPALADALQAVVEGRGVEKVLQRIGRLGAQIAGRGGCAHPDGALTFVRSGLEVFAGEIERHRRGSCTAARRPPVLRTPNPNGRRQR